MGMIFFCFYTSIQRSIIDYHAPSLQLIECMAGVEVKKWLKQEDDEEIPSYI